MTTTPNYSFTIAEGTDTVNLLTQSYPNFTNLDTILKTIEETGITTSVATKVGTVFQIVRTNTDLDVMRFVATANYASGDTFTVDGVAVTATGMNGAALPAGAFVINQSVECIKNGSVLTVVGVGGVSSVDAEDVTYDNTVSGLTATDVQNAIDELAARPVVAAAEDVTYDNTLSGLTATDVQAAIDELKALIPATPTYVTTGLVINAGRCTINDGGYYIDSNNICHVDITITTTQAGSNDMVFVYGFPQAATAVPGSGITYTTATFNNFCIGQHYQLLTSLVCRASLTTGTYHFIGSYQIA